MITQLYSKFFKSPSTECKPVDLNEIKSEIQTIRKDFLKKTEFANVPKLDKKHIKNCRLVPSRNDLLKIMPTNPICAEIGILFGDFTNEIIHKCLPKKLHLI